MAETMDTDEFLAHHGVKGMKWGKRQAVSKDVKVARKAAFKAGQQDHLNKRRETMLKTHADGSQSVSGAKVAKTMLADFGSYGAYSATKSAKLAGASNGKAVVVGMLGGPIGAQIYVNRQIKKKVNAAIQ